MVVQKSFSTHRNAFPFLKTPFFHKQSITTIRPSLLPTKKGQPRKATLLYGKGGPPPSSAAPHWAMRRAIPLRSITSLVMTIPQKPPSTLPAPRTRRLPAMATGIPDSGLRQHGRTCGVHPQWEHHAPVFRSVGRRVLFSRCAARTRAEKASGSRRSPWPTP